MRLTRRAALVKSGSVVGLVALGRRAHASGLSNMTSADAGAAPADGLRFERDDRFSGWLPVRFDSSSHLIMQVRANGLATTAIIDSGAGRSIIDKTFAARLKLKPGGAFRAAGVTSNADGELASGLVVRLGDVVLSGLETAVLDLSVLSTVGGSRIELIIGRELFDRTLDFAKDRLGIFSFDEAPKADAAIDLELVADGKGRRYVPISLGRAGDLSACYDLGSDVPLVISPDFASENGLLDGLRVSTAASAGVSGVSLGRVAVLPRITVGGVPLLNVPIQVPDNWNQSGPALAGLPIWSRFINTIDYSRNRLSLAPIPAAVAAPFPKDRSGIGAARGDGRLRIIHVAEGSPAEAIGLRTGDEITAVDGHAIDTDFLASQPRIGARPAGTKVLLTLADRRQLTLVLQDYF